MSITVNRISDDGLVVVVDSELSMYHFKALVQRAMNLWPDASPELKEFADKVTNSDLVDPMKEGLQDYKMQDTSPKKWVSCSKCGKAQKIPTATKKFMCEKCSMINPVSKSTGI